MNAKIVLLKGDGIGPEIINEAVKCLNKIGEKFGHNFEFSEQLISGVAIDETGTPLPDETVKACLEADAVMLGAVGGPKWDSLPPEKRPEKGLLGIRKALNLFANLRPVKLIDAVKAASPLKPEIRDKGIDLIIVRELTGGIYFGKKEAYTENGENVSLDEMVYRESEIDRLLKVAFDVSKTRKNKVCLVDKANVLKTSQHWRKRFEAYETDAQKSIMLVDNAAMQLIRQPESFDVIVTENMFGDILSDEAAVLTGSIGLIPSASLSTNGKGLYEPIHGSAPDIAKTGKANPLATILSAAMLLRFSLNLHNEAECLEKAVYKAVEKYRTADIFEDGKEIVSTSQMGDKVLEIIGGKL